MKIKKKAVALLAGVMTAMSCGSMMSSAATDNFLLGDANGDGVINITDSVRINQYILGGFVASGDELTRMDVNQDCVIDSTDVLMVQYMMADIISPVTVNKEAYKAPNYESRAYYRHDCNSSNANNKTRYTLGNLPQTMSENEIAEYATRPDNRDQENTNVVQLNLGGATGSGFIVAPHVVATAAHCVYDKDTGFIRNITVNIYNKDGEVSSNNLVHTSKARYTHIPEQYLNNINNNNIAVNYDYALIYVEDDLSDYGIWSMGVSVDDFMDTGKFLTASGFTDINKEKYARYYSDGPVRAYDKCYEEDKNLDYRISAESASYSGKSGGVLYYKSSYDNRIVSSVVGVVTGGSANVNYTWAVRMTPTLLQFYKQNTKLTG